ncbi:MAG TPA: serine hydrolase, partial [Acidimicrobiia bacterium]|nr:serine hydrolase [Acidimicrobiia bacterium]
MLRRPRAFATLLVALMSVLAAAPSAMAATTSKTTPRSRTVATSSTAPPTPKAYVLVDADTGTVLAASGEHTPLPPASTVKIMTGLTALRRLVPDATIKVSARAAAQPAMKIGMHEGEVWPLNDVLHTLYMVSANDSAYALAETAGGTVENFATAMDDTAKQLGMVDSSFNDPAGLDDAASVKGGSRMSAWDLAIAARNALAVPQIADVVKLLDYKFTGPDGVPHSLHNH